MDYGSIWLDTEKVDDRGLVFKIRETLINSSFRAERSGDPESSSYNSVSYWIPAFAGMTGKQLISFPGDTGMQFFLIL